MLRINEIKLSLDTPESELKNAAAKVLGIPPDRIESWSVYRRSIDSRKKDSVCFSYSVDLKLSINEEKLQKKFPSSKVSVVKDYSYVLPECRRTSGIRPVVVGFGPAGMFCALTLARAGLRPIVLERGNDVDTRKSDIRTFFSARKLDTESNVQFGEGGAGTFSDGKLTTGIKSDLCRKVFLEFVSHGAPEDILVSATPHIGTDKLVGVVKSIREEIISLGGEVRFASKLTDLIIFNKHIQGVTVKSGSAEYGLECDTLILCVGHSARDTAAMLRSHGLEMMQKPFSVGARIEHPREFIDRAQYGPFAGHKALPAAVYKLACHFEHERGAYTFCMCPGGTVISAASEEGGVVTNGMSEYARDKENSNAAILVNVYPKDFPSDDVLAGFELQREMERTAFRIGGGDYTAPAQRVGDFLDHRASVSFGSVRPSFTTGVVPSDIRLVLPPSVTETMEYGIRQMDKKLRGFALPDAVLTAPESRSSSPVRVIRDDIYQSNIRGIYPCGEGAGYAGGIVSAAVDGLHCAHAVLADEE